MKAIQFPARNEVVFGDLPEPSAGPGQVVVKVRASGICHTDFEVLRANYGTGAFPVVPGHEYAGVVAEVGSGVENVSVGDRVVVDPNIECGVCAACLRGWAHLCDALQAYGVTRNGGFAEFSVVAADAVHAIGDMSFDKAALAEPMGCVLNGLSAARASEAGNAIIFGAGPMGMLLAVGLNAVGVKDVTLVDVNAARLAFAEDFGFGAVASGSPELSRWKHGADLAIDATGVPEVAAELIGYTVSGGTVLYFGVCSRDARIEISPFEVFRRQLTLAGSHSLNHNIPDSLHALNSFDGDLARVISHRLSLEEVAEIFADHPPQGSLKIQATFE